MPLAIIRFSVLCVVLTLVTGCGGSSGSSGGTNSTTITYEFLGTAPSAVAVKIGSGGFATATISSSELSFTLPDGTTDFAVAYNCPGFSFVSNFTQNLEYLNYSSSLDGTRYFGSCPSNPTGSSFGGTLPNTPTAALTGNVNSSSFPGASELFVWASTANSGYGQPFNLPLNGGFDISFEPPGTYNVVLILEDSYSNALAVKSVSDQTAPGAVDNGSSVDFGAGDATTFQPITYVNVPTGYSVPSTSVNVDSQELNIGLQMNGNFGFNTGNQYLLTQYSMLPAGIAQSGDIYQIESTASEQLPSATDVVNFSTILTGGGPATIAFPMPRSYAGPVPEALPTIDFSYTGLAGQSGTNYSADLQWTPASGIQDSIEILLTSHYQSAFPSVTVPDLSAISGFLAAPASGTAVTWLAEIGNNGGVAAGFGSATTGSTTSSSTLSNGTSTSVSSSGTYTVP